MGGPYLTLDLIYERSRDMKETLKAFLECGPKSEVKGVSFHKWTSGYHLESIDKKFKSIDHIFEELEHSPTGTSVHLDVSFIDGLCDISVYTQAHKNKNSIHFIMPFSIYYEKITHPEIYEGYCKLIENSVQATKPVYAAGSFELENGAFFEYFADPYGFCSPVLKISSARYAHPGDLADGLEHPIVLAEKQAAKKLLPISQLKKIIKQNTLKTMEVGNGFGAWNSGPYGEGQRKRLPPTEFYPCYALRKELRKRGATLFFGSLEADLISELLIVPEAYFKQGYLSRETADALKAKTEELKKTTNGKETYEQEETLVLETLSKQELHELGLDLPKPPRELMK